MMMFLFLILIIVVGYFYFTDKGFQRSFNKTGRRLGNAIEDKFNDLKDKFDEE